jgi:hypothetical protein
MNAQDVTSKIQYYYDCEWEPFPTQATDKLMSFESRASQHCRSTGSGWRIGYTPAGADYAEVMARTRQLFMTDQQAPNVTLVRKTRYSFPRANDQCPRPLCLHAEIDPFNSCVSGFPASLSVTAQVGYDSEASMVADMVPPSYVEAPGVGYSCIFGVVFSALDNPSRKAEYALRFDSTPGYWYGEPPHFRALTHAHSCHLIPILHTVFGLARPLLSDSQRS